MSSSTAFGVTIAGEFSAGYNDCGLFLKGVNGTTTYGGDCSFWQDSSQWNSTIKEGVMNFATASMDALQNWFFWTWKIGNSNAGIPESPLWSYQLGLEGGWIPKDPRVAVGRCSTVGVVGPQFNGTYESWQTGEAGAGQLSPTLTQQFPWPPASLNAVAGPASLLPSYVPTGVVETLPAPTPTGNQKSVSEGDGWFDVSDTASAYTAIAGCTYPDAWSGIGVPVPTQCSPAAKRAIRIDATPTAVPARRR